MYLSEKPRPIDFYKEGGPDRDMMIEAASVLPPPPHHHSQQQQQQQHMTAMLGESSGEDHEMKAPKKRAETWVQDETRCLINFRREVDALFNTSKSNKHLWDQISAKMRDKGFDRSPTMCTDKWRNLLKEYKKLKHHDGTAASSKLSYYKDLEDLMRDRTKHAAAVTPHSNKLVDPSYIHFSDKAIEDATLAFGHGQSGGRAIINSERRLDHEGDPLTITAGETVVPNGVPPWNWRETAVNEDQVTYNGRVISVKLMDYTRRIGIDGTTDAIKEAIKSAFRLRTKRAFWLEDEYQIVRSLDRDMPLGNYTLHLDEGITIKVCLFDDAGRITEEKTLYTEDDFRDYLHRRALTGLRELNGYRSIDTLDDLHTGEVYQGVRMVGE